MADAGAVVGVRQRGARIVDGSSCAVVGGWRVLLEEANGDGGAGGYACGCCRAGVAGAEALVMAPAGCCCCGVCGGGCSCGWLCEASMMGWRPPRSWAALDGRARPVVCCLLLLPIKAALLGRCLRTSEPADASPGASRGTAILSTRSPLFHAGSSAGSWNWSIFMPLEPTTVRSAGAESDGWSEGARAVLL